MNLKKGLRKQTLRKYGFNRIGEFEWTRTTTIYAYKDRPLISLKCLIDTDDKSLNYTVLDNNTGTVYSPFYIGSDIPNRVLNEVKERVEYELNKLIKVGVICE